MQAEVANSFLNEVRDGKTPSRGEALRMTQARGDALEELLETAAALRDRHKGKTVTFSPKIFIPLTNLCRDFCGYCTFRKAPGEAGAKTMSIDEVLAVARRGKFLGCTEALFSLGDKPEAIYPEMKAFLARLRLKRTLDYLYDACKATLEHTGILPHANPGIMGAGDLKRLKEVNPSMGLMLETTSERLMLPGGAHDNAPDKKPSLRLRTIAEAGKLRIPFTTGILIGIGETWEERIDSLCAIRELNERYGHVQEVIVQNFRPKPEIPMRERPEPARDDMLKTIALARLILGGAMNLQAPPNLTPEGYPIYLRAGINDWGGVSPLTPDFINPEAPWPALVELERRTREAGYVLRARLPIYPEYITDEFVPASLRPHIEDVAGADGLVNEAIELRMLPRGERVSEDAPP
jgi:FO synthase